MGIDTPVNESGGGGAVSITFRNYGTNAPLVSGVVDEIVVPDGSLEISGTTATISRFPTTGPNYNGEGANAIVPSFAVTMNQFGAPVIDIMRNRQMVAQDGAPEYRVTGKFVGGKAIKLGREYGVLTCKSDQNMSNTASSYGAQTINCWAKLEGSGASEVGFVWELFESSGNRFFLFTNTTGIRIGVVNGSSLVVQADYATLLGYATPIDIFDGAFHMFTVSRRYTAEFGRQIQLWIDGRLVAATNDAQLLGILGTPAANFTIGGEDGNGGGGAIVTMDELVMANQWWETNQVQGMYFGGTGLSIASPQAQYYGFNVDPLDTINGYINHIWRFNESAGNTAADEKSFAALIMNGANESFGATGRWPGTTALALDGTTDNARLYRLNNFDGPDTFTPWAVSMDVKIDGRGTTTLGRNCYIFEIGDGANTSAPYANAGLQAGDDVMFFVLGGIITLTLPIDASYIGDGLFHTFCFGVRNRTGRREVFVGFEGELAFSEVSSWPDLSGAAIDVVVGETLKFTGFNHRTIVGSVQNIVMWKGVDFTDGMIDALNGAELVLITG